MNTDLDTLKSQWQNLDAAPSKADNREEMARKIIRRGIASRSEKIARFYRVNIALCLIWVGISGTFSIERIFPLWLVILMAVYFGVMAFLSFVVLERVKDIDLSRMNVVQAMEYVCRLQKARMWQKAVGFALCLPLMVCLLAYFSRVSSVMLVGGIVGAIFGLFIGFVIDGRIRRQIREMESELRDSTLP